MYYFLFAIDAITQEGASAWTSLMEGAARWGLGIALAILLVGLLFLIIKRVMNGIDSERIARNEENAKERDMFMRILDSRDLTINNHLDHVQLSLNGVKESHILLTKTMEGVGEKIVKAIDNQTDLIMRNLKSKE